MKPAPPDLAARHNLHARLLKTFSHNILDLIRLRVTSLAQIVTLPH
jgi:hypothetical protein